MVRLGRLDTGFPYMQLPKTDTKWMKTANVNSSLTEREKMRRTVSQALHEIEPPGLFDPLRILTVVFTDGNFVDAMRRHDIAISIDGGGCWRDKAVVE